MLLNKRKVSVVTKVGAVIVALAFVVGLISFSMVGSDPGNTAAPQQQVQEKIASLEQAALKNPKSADAWIVLGNAYQDANFYDKAVASYEKALSIDPKRTNVRVDMAISCYGLGQLETATAQAKKAIETDPKFAPAYYNLGVFLVSQGKNQEALDAYEKYVKLDPNGERVNDARQQIDTLSKAVNAGVSGEPVVGTGGSDSASSTGGK
ncbi:MAG: tetratricopeptide repeat protein [Candidatus Aquicultor sp.]